MMGVEGGGRDGSSSRQIEVELAAALLAGAQTSRPGVVARLQELREAWREHSRQEEARGARQGQLLREVDRVDREAARLALETARHRGFACTKPPSRAVFMKNIYRSGELFFGYSYRENETCFKSSMARASR